MKIFESFYERIIKESVDNNISNDILEQLETTIQDMVDKIVTYEQEQIYKRELSDYDKEMIRINLIYDMLKSLETYTKPDDKLLFIKASWSKKSNIKINGTIERDGVEYEIETEAIYAGGHNIQTLHYRYITKTNLPRTGNSFIQDVYKEKKKRLTKIEKLNADVKYLQNVIKREENNYSEGMAASDDDILMKNDYYWNNNRLLTWEEIVRRGADKNFNYDKEEWLKSQEDYKQGI
jgi:hypothetical protein